MFAGLLASKAAPDTVAAMTFVFDGNAVSLDRFVWVATRDYPAAVQLAPGSAVTAVDSRTDHRFDAVLSRVDGDMVWLRLA